jgi:hypothetical protein
VKVGIKDLAKHENFELSWSFKKFKIIMLFFRYDVLWDWKKFLKGQCHENFDVTFFHESVNLSPPPSPRISSFSENSRKY